VFFGRALEAQSLLRAPFLLGAPWRESTVLLLANANAKPGQRVLIHGRGRLGTILGHMQKKANEK
jgi:hypothetical protein